MQKRLLSKLNCQLLVLTKCTIAITVSSFIACDSSDNKRVHAGYGSNDMECVPDRI